MIVRVALMKNGPPYTGFGLRADLRIGVEWRRFHLLVQATADAGDARLDFLPGGSFHLDEVSVRKQRQAPPTIPVRRVRPGRGWQPQAANLVDGDPRTAPARVGHPVLPLLLTLDLGSPRPVGAVIVKAQDRGRHLATLEMSCEVSAEGRAWRRWAPCTKSVLTKGTGTRVTRFLATNSAVSVRFVRLRITRLRLQALLTEVQVLAASGADSEVLSSLVPVPAAAAVAFQGWNYDRLGYDASPGEAVALRFVNQGDEPMTLPVR